MAARAHFMDAVSLEADCMEAIYNLGLVSKGVGNLDDALTAFKRLNAMLTEDTAAMFQVCPVHFHSVQFHSARFHSGQFRLAQFHSAQFPSVQFHSVQVHSVQFHSVQNAYSCNVA